MEVFGIKTDLIGIGDNMVEALERGMKESGLSLKDGGPSLSFQRAPLLPGKDKLYSEDVKPSRLACDLATQVLQGPAGHGADPEGRPTRLLEAFLGVVLTMNKGFLYPNAGIDHSNAPPGYVVLFPADPEIASIIHGRVGAGKRIGVIVGDSRTHPLRSVRRSGFGLRWHRAREGAPGARRICTAVPS